jgi:hypothetical protein
LCSSAEIPRADPKLLFEGPAEMGRVAEAPKKCDFGNCFLLKLGIGKIPAALI